MTSTELRKTLERLNINQQQERCFALGHNSAPSQGRFRGA
jgi:hypothetical protein